MTPRMPGVVHVNVAVKLEWSDFFGWRPEQVKAFLEGIAQVVSANEPADSIEGTD